MHEQAELVDETSLQQRAVEPSAAVDANHASAFVAGQRRQRGGEVDAAPADGERADGRLALGPRRDG